MFSSFEFLLILVNVYRLRGHAPNQIALIVNVIVAWYEPTLYVGSLVRIHETDALFPDIRDRASDPKLATDVALVVDAVIDPEHGAAVPLFPGLAALQVYVSLSCTDGGLATDGPPVGLKSLVTCRTMLPLPPCDVRMK
jgi:hypothetical protein